MIKTRINQTMTATKIGTTLVIVDALSTAVPVALG